MPQGGGLTPKVPSSLLTEPPTPEAELETASLGFSRRVLTGIMEETAGPGKDLISLLAPQQRRKDEKAEARERRADGRYLIRRWGCPKMGCISSTHPLLPGALRTQVISLRHPPTGSEFQDPLVPGKLTPPSSNTPTLPIPPQTSRFFNHQISGSQGIPCQAQAHFPAS